MKRAVVAVVAAVGVATGCAASTGRTVTAPRPSDRPLYGDQAPDSAVGQLIKRVEHLQGPRPVVVLGPVVIAPQGGFQTGDQKQAFVTGRFSVAPDVLTRARNRRTNGIRSVDEALHLLRATRTTCCFGKSVAPLVVTSARLTTAPFVTDRGRRSLPAWAFELNGLAEPALVLAAPAASTVTLPDGATSPNVHAVISRDQRHLTVQFVGAAPGDGACEANYTATATEGPGDVVVRVVEHPGRAPAGGVVCDLAGYSRQVALSLSQPLGSKIVLAGGRVVEVDTAAA